LKKKKIQNIIIALIAILIIGSIAVYNYSSEQTKQKGLQFGIELEQIQEEVQELQIKFYSEKTRWNEGDISKEELLEYYEKHGSLE
jgi:Zn-dependent oligopeptidase